jgi:hypothetical protein
VKHRYCKGTDGTVWRVEHAQANGWTVVTTWEPVGGMALAVASVADERWSQYQQERAEAL